MQAAQLTAFLKFAREERQFCAIFAHLLLQKGPNLGRFLDLANSHLADGIPNPNLAPRLDDAQVYLEFTFLRDHWNELDRGTPERRDWILSYMSRVEGLREFAQRDLPTDPSRFNRLFAGESGARFRDDYAYPGRWTVQALADSFRQEPHLVRELCRFKWAFNIKPDLVIVLPDAPPLVIEAKLESKEGSYPSSYSECNLFDEMGLSRVGQLELQGFMFESLLGVPCRSMFLVRDPSPYPQPGGVPLLTWREVFLAMDLDSSIPFVRRLIMENRHLGVRSD